MSNKEKTEIHARWKELEYHELYEKMLENDRGIEMLGEEQLLYEEAELERQYDPTFESDASS